MTTDKQDSMAAFEVWFYASKYTQVVNPRPGDLQLARDTWQASRKQMREDVIQELSGMSCNNATAKSAIKLCIEAMGEMK